MSALQEPQACHVTQMRTLTRMDKRAIDDYNHITKMDKNVN